MFRVSDSAAQYIRNIWSRKTERGEDAGGEGRAKIRGERASEESSSTRISHSPLVLQSWKHHPVITSPVILLCASDEETPLALWFWIGVKSFTVHHWTWWSIGDNVRYGWSIVRCCHRTIGWHGSPLRCSTWRRPCGMGSSCASSSTTWDPSPSTWGRSTWDLRCHR